MAMLWEEEKFRHLDVGCPLRYILDDNSYEDVTLGCFARNDGKLYALTYRPSRPCSRVQVLACNTGVDCVTYEPVLQLTNGTARVFSTGQIAAICLRDQDSVTNRVQLKAAMEHRGKCFYKYIDIKKCGDAQRCKVDVYVDRHVKVDTNTDVQSTQSGGVRFGKVVRSTSEKLLVTSNVINGHSRGALVTSMLDLRQNKCTVYGILGGQEQNPQDGSTVAVVHWLDKELEEMEQGNFAGSRFTLCSPD